MIPAVLMNIFEEWVFDDTDNKFDVWVLLSFESIYQVLTFLVLFWLDIMPGFGTSSDISQWADSIRDGFQCVFAPGSLNFTAPVNATAMYNYNHCYNSALLGFLFTGAYVMSYVFGAMLMKHASANFAGIVTSIGSPLAVVFWFCFPAVNHWQCGPVPGKLGIIFSAIALVPMTAGAYLFRRFEFDRGAEDTDQTHTRTKSVSLLREKSVSNHSRARSISKW